MSDLIERLRHRDRIVHPNSTETATLVREAADEIERLTAEVEHMTGCRDTQHGIACNLDEENKALTAELEATRNQAIAEGRIVHKLQARVDALEGALAGAVRELEDLSCSGPGGDNEGCYDWSKYTDLAATEQEGET